MALGANEHGDGAALGEKRHGRAPDEHDERARQVARERARMGAESGDEQPQHRPHVERRQIQHAGPGQQRAKQRGARERHDEEQFERRLGDELQENDLPVGGGDQRAALQEGFDRQRVRHHTHGIGCRVPR
jgi:hypothetical protein